MALHASCMEYELREVDLKNKPAPMLAASPKGSVPVLILEDGKVIKVIDESYDIMQWALRSHDPKNWLGEEGAYLLPAASLVEKNDIDFKQALDGYKYAGSELSREHFRTAGEISLRELEGRLNETSHLLGNTLSIADVAIFPFIRQFAAVDAGWFANAPYPALRLWLAGIVDSPRFAAVMQKHPLWQPALENL